MNLEEIGWDSFFAGHFEPYARQGLAPGRVVLQHNRVYELYTEAGEASAEIAGRLKYLAAGSRDLPAVGDWVALRMLAGERGKAVIEDVLPRRSKFSRRAAGRETEEQVVAANVDTLFLVMGLDHDYNLRRVERYLIMARESGARAVVVLNKADVVEDAAEKVREVERVALGVPVYLLSAKQGLGLEQLAPYTGPGQTVSLVGSSGVGKSTIINRLLGRERQRTGEVRAGDDRGRHTTTHRELMMLPTGGLIIDTPGMRELQLLVADRSLQETFEEIEELGAQCRFRDCGHAAEPGCAVREALGRGELDAARYANYRKMQQEMAELDARETPAMKRHCAEAEKERAKKVHQALKLKNKRRQQ